MTRVYDKTWLAPSVAADLKRTAAYGTFAGRQPDRYLRRQTALHAPTGSLLIFTRDLGHHSCGWWKNPDYERCWHLSLSFRDPVTGDPAQRDRKLTRSWVELFFGADRDKLWCEPPYSAEGKAREVWHYRLFCDGHWRPLLPRGEVYSRELTEAGYKTFSEVRADLEAAEEEVLARLADPAKAGRSAPR